MLTLMGFVVILIYDYSIMSVLCVVTRFGARLKWCELVSPDLSAHDTINMTKEYLTLCHVLVSN